MIFQVGSEVIFAMIINQSLIFDFLAFGTLGFLESGFGFFGRSLILHTV